MATMASRWTAEKHVDKHATYLIMRNADRTFAAVRASSRHGPRTVLVDVEDLDLLRHYPSVGMDDHPRIGEDYLHTMVTITKQGGTQLPSGTSIYHVNGVKTDNRRDNLVLTDRTPPTTELINLGIERLPRGMYFESTTQKYVYEPQGRPQINGTQSALVTPINKFRDCLMKMIADLEANPDKEHDDLPERLAKEHNDIVAAAHAAEPDTFPDGPYTDVGGMCSELAFCRTVLSRLPPVAPGEVLHGPRNIGKQFFPPGTPGLPAGSAALIKGDTKLLFDGQFYEQMLQLPEIDFSTAVPCLIVTALLKRLFPTLAVSTRKVPLRDIIWQFMMGKGPVPLDHALVPINYQQLDVRAENLRLMPGTGKDHRSRSSIHRVPEYAVSEVGMKYMPRDTSFGIYKNANVLFTRAPNGELIKIQRTPQSGVGSAFNNKLLPILRANNPNFDKDNALFQRLAGEYEDFCANMTN